MGRTFRAIRDSEVAASSSGVNLPLYKTLAFGLSAFYAGIAGSLFALATTFVNPDTFPIVLSLYLVIGAVISGLGSIWGIAAGALFIRTSLTWPRSTCRRRQALPPLRTRSC